MLLRRRINVRRQHGFSSCIGKRSLHLPPSPPRLPLFRNAEYHAKQQRVAVISSLDSQTEPKSFTYANLLLDSADLAKQITPKDLEEQSVAFLTPHSYDYVRTQWAIWRAGGIAVPLCTSHPPPELEYHILDSRSKVIVGHPHFSPVLKPIALKHGIKYIELSPPNSSSENTDSKEFLNFDVEPERRAQIIYTSGTTGKPKGVVTTHKIIQAQIECLVEAWEWTHKDHILHVLPLHHVHGVINALLCALWSGATVEMLPKFDAMKVWEKFMAPQSNISLFMAVPTIYQKLIKAYNSMDAAQQKAATEGAKRLRLMVSGSAPLPEPIFYHWKQISGHTLLERFGMTEIGMALSNPLHGPRIPGKVGTPLPGVQVKIAPDDPSDPNQGELLVKGPQVFLEYYGRPEATKESFTEDGWFKTGDSVELKDGTYRILGRRSVDVPKSGGYKISALEVETVLLSHPNIHECAVVGLPDEEWGQLIAAIVVLNDPTIGLSLKDLQAWSREKLANYKIPRALLLLNEIPRNAMGKINKKELVKLFESHQYEK